MFSDAVKAGWPWWLSLSLLLSLSLPLPLQRLNRISGRALPLDKARPSEHSLPNAYHALSVPTGREALIWTWISRLPLLCFLLANVLFAPIVAFSVSRGCFLLVQEKRRHVHRRLTVHGRCDGETADWHRPSASPPCLQRTPRSDELQELPQAKSVPSCLSGPSADKLTDRSPRSSAIAPVQPVKHARCSTARVSTVWLALHRG